MRWTALAMAVWLTGCSFAFVSGPPENHEQLPYFTCTESRVVPALDTVWTALQTANFVLATANDDQGWHDTFCSKGDASCSPPLSRGVAIPVYIGLALAGAAGMYYGFSRTGQCRAAKAQAAIRMQQGATPNLPPAPGTWPPPPAPGAPAPAPAPAPVPAPAPAPAPYAPPAPAPAPATP
jgi:hypothetical protein